MDTWIPFALGFGSLAALRSGKNPFRENPVSIDDIHNLFNFGRDPLERNFKTFALYNRRLRRPYKRRRRPTPWEIEEKRRREWLETQNLDPDDF